MFNVSDIMWKFNITHLENTIISLVVENTKNAKDILPSVDDKLVDVVPAALIVLLTASVLYLYELHHTIGYYVKFFTYYFLVSVSAVICIPIFVFTPKDVKNSLWVSHALKYISPIIGVGYKLRNPESLVADRGAVVVSNHQSTFDILGLFNIWSVMGKCAVVAKGELFYVWPFGLGAWLAGVVFIDRMSAANAYKQLEYPSKLMREDKTKIWMFAEGTRNKNANTSGKLLPFKKGAFRIAITCQVPVVPVVFSPYYFIDRRRKRCGRGTVNIKALPEISTEGLTMDDLDDLIQRTQDIMNEEFKKLHNEIYSSPLPSQYLHDK